jgi:prophage antirepressor-like protein
MNEMVEFAYEGREVRTVIKNGEPEWVAKDVAEVLGYPETSNPARLFAHVPEEWKGVNPIHTPGGMQNMLCLLEPGLYFFLGRSDKPLALPFQKWIAGDVIPSIRKKGFYALPGKGQGEQEEWKRNFPYPFMLLEDAAVRMREMRLAIGKGLLRADVFQLVVTGEANSGKTDIDPDITAFLRETLKITGDPREFTPIADIKDRYIAENEKFISQNALTRVIKSLYPGLEYKQKKIGGYPVQVFFGCKLPKKKEVKS